MTGTGDETRATAVIPDALVERDQWVCWREEDRDGKATKVPVTPGTGDFASTTDPGTWTEFESALGFVDAGEADGVGFVFTEDDPLVGVDLDDCRVPETGNPDSTAADVIERLDSYTEVSPSGTGFHVLVAGDLPDGRNRRGSVELYDTARFFTVTGEHVDGTPCRVAKRQDAIAGIHRDYVQDQSKSGDDAGQERQSSAGSIGLEDTEILAKARSAENSEKFETLWNGTTAGYDSHSEADMALCCLLAFWTGGDRSQIDRLFRQSRLMREKWDEVHYADGSTYGEKTVERAASTVTEHYDPDGGTDPTDPSRSDIPDQECSIGSRDQTYLVERNRLLEDRVDELQTVVREKNERIEALKDEIREFREEWS